MHTGQARPGRRRLRLAGLAAPISVVATLLGGSAAGAAVHGPSPVAAVARPGKAPALAPLVWHPLTLLNGWKSASTASLPYGTPAWASRGGVVYLRGAIKDTVPDGDSTFGTLPASARPAHDLYLQVFTAGETPGTLYISPDGTMDAYDGALSLVSLAAVSYPAATMASSSLALENGWTSSQSVYDTGNPGYAVKGGVVYLSGSMHSARTARLALVLPKAARPARDLYVSVYTLDSSTGWLQIRPTGQVYVNGQWSTGYTSLAGISFPVASTTWAYFKLSAPWKSDAVNFRTGAPAYAVIDGIVYLTGSMDQPTAGSGLWAVLPAVVRTKADVLDIEVDLAAGATGGVTITNRLGLAASAPFSKARSFTSLAAIAYPQNS